MLETDRERLAEDRGRRVALDAPVDLRRADQLLDLVRAGLGGETRLDDGSRGLRRGSRSRRERVFGDLLPESGELLRRRRLVVSRRNHRSYRRDRSVLRAPLFPLFVRLELLVVLV